MGGRYTDLSPLGFGKELLSMMISEPIADTIDDLDSLSYTVVLTVHSCGILPCFFKDSVFWKLSREYQKWIVGILFFVCRDRYFPWSGRAHGVALRTAIG